MPFDWMNLQKYEPPGPISRAFFEDFTNRIQMIMGPFGSGKTTTALMKFLLIAANQRPSPIDGVRYTKFAVVRDTYVNLNRTALSSWQEWLGEFGTLTGGKNSPAVHVIKFDLTPHLPTQDIVEMRVEFIALGEKSIADVMKGWEGTAAYLNEADGMLLEAMTFLNGRVGRYPGIKDGGPTWSGLLLDMNAPDDENWTYETFIEKIEEYNAQALEKHQEAVAAGKLPADSLPPTLKFYRQPGGFDEGAENLQNLQPGYYENLILGAEDWWIRRFVDNLFGYDRTGYPIYDTYRDSFHCAPAWLTPIPGIPVTLGADQGRWGGIVFGQELPTGQWRIFHEILAENIDATILGRVFNEEVAKEFPDIRIGSAWCDPAGNSGSDHDDTTFIKILSESTGIKWKPAPLPSNSIQTRITAVKIPLNRLIDGKPGLLISPRCKKLRKGFNSGYHYKRVAEAGGSGRRADKPNKKVIYATPHDCLQYMMIGGGTHLGAMGLKRRQGSGGMRSRVAKSNFNPLARTR